MMSRWADYYIDREFVSFWRRRARDPKLSVLLLLGVGFDPRCIRTLEALRNCGLPNGVNYLAFKLIAPRVVTGAADLMETVAKRNLENLQALTGCKAEALHELATHDSEGHNVVGWRATAAVADDRQILSNYSDVIVDVSGMPRGMFFPLVKYLLRQADAGMFKNLHLAVVEDPVLDSHISAKEYGQADYLHTFRYQGESKVVWLPLLGGDETTRLQKIHNKIESACIEICPILPFPASSLRRVDDVILRHADVLFESFVASPDNVILCDERNPFDAYRKILEVEEYYRNRLGALADMGVVSTVLSPLSSKTLSVGMALAAIERRLPVCHVEAGAYHVDVDSEGNLVADPGIEPTEIWLTGEPYEA